MAYKNKDIKKMIELYKIGNSMEQIGQIFGLRARRKYSNMWTYGNV